MNKASIMALRIANRNEIRETIANLGRLDNVSSAKPFPLRYTPAKVIEKKIASYQKNKTRFADEPRIAMTAAMLSKNLMRLPT